MHKLLNRFWWLGPLVAAICIYGAIIYGAIKGDIQNDINREKAALYDKLKDKCR
jgi:hypothetical protein